MNYTVNFYIKDNQGFIYVNGHFVDQCHVADLRRRLHEEMDKLFGYQEKQMFYHDKLKNYSIWHKPEQKASK
jgi:hypothetical protein